MQLPNGKSATIFGHVFTYYACYIYPTLFISQMLLIILKIKQAMLTLTYII